MNDEGQRIKVRTFNKKIYARLTLADSDLGVFPGARSVDLSICSRTVLVAAIMQRLDSASLIGTGIAGVRA